MAEEWRSVRVPGAENVYEVSDQGRVIRVAPGRGTQTGLMKPYNLGLYLGVTLTYRARGLRSKHYVHDLVAGAFIGPKAVGMTVNHKNLVKHDNRATNLEYVTHADNVRHGVRAGARTSDMEPETVLKLRRLYRAGAKRKDLARRFGVTVGTVWHIGTGRTHGHLIDEDLDQGMELLAMKVGG